MLLAEQTTAICKEHAKKIGEIRNETVKKPVSYTHLDVYKRQDISNDYADGSYYSE